MRLADLLRIALSALWQQKVRTLLTILGVMTGTLALVITISVGLGVHQAIERQFRLGQQVRQIEVLPNYEADPANLPPEALDVKGEMSEAKRERLRQVVLRRWNQDKPVRRPSTPLTRERIQAIATLDHVEAVAPRTPQGSQVVWNSKNYTVFTYPTAWDNQRVLSRLVAGEGFPTPTGAWVLVHEYLLYRWGITSEEQVQGVLGKPLQLKYRPAGRTPPLLQPVAGVAGISLTADERQALQEFHQKLPAVFDQLQLSADTRRSLDKLFQNLGEELKTPVEPLRTQEFIIVGVVRDPVGDDRFTDVWETFLSRDADLFVPVKAAEELWVNSVSSGNWEFSSMAVTVDREENVKQVADQIKNMKLKQYSLADVLQQMRRGLVLTTFVMGFLATIALLVAALGITNTMVMSVLERIREIGVMKAIGARDRHILVIFLVEGTLLGLIGGGLGLLLGWLTSFPGDAIARDIVQSQTDMALEERLFLFPSWLLLAAPAFAMLVTTLAALYPARRAAKVRPITALRHE